MASTDNSASAEGTKRTAEGAAEGQPQEKALKVEETGTSAKLERRDSAVSDAGTSAKLERRDSAVSDSGNKEKKDKKDKSDKKDKDKKEKKEKDEKKDKVKDEKKVKEEKKETPAETAAKAALNNVGREFDQRKLMKEGQKMITPPVADATRGFYHSLFEENPNSKMAIKFCVEYGILPVDEHKKLLKKYNVLKDKGAFDPRKVAAMTSEQMKKLTKKRASDAKKDGGKEEEKKEKKEKDDKDKKEKKEKKEKDGDAEVKKEGVEVKKEAAEVKTEGAEVKKEGTEVKKEGNA